MQHQAIMPHDTSAEGRSAGHARDGVLCRSAITAHPQLLPVLAGLSRELRDLFIVNARLGRTLGSHQRWMLTQAAFALHVEYDSADKLSGLTVGRLRDLIAATSAASRNTVLNFMEEMRHHRYVRDVPPPPGVRSRRRRIEVTETAHEAMVRWLSANLRVLDQLDGGNRVAVHEADPALLSRVQPVMIRACLNDPDWLDPPGAVGLFQWTEGGALVMDEILVRAGGTPADAEGRVAVGQINIRVMADAYLMSHTHLQRLFRKAAEAGVIGWTGARRKADLWVSAGYLRDYARWQAVKLAYLERAYRQALAGA